MPKTNDRNVIESLHRKQKRLEVKIKVLKAFLLGACLGWVPVYLAGRQDGGVKVRATNLFCELGPGTPVIDADGTRRTSPVNCYFWEER